MLELLTALFLLIGAAFALIGSIGLARLPDLFMRLHAPTKSSTLGLGSFLIAAIIYAAFHGRLGFADYPLDSIDHFVVIKGFGDIVHRTHAHGVYR